MRKTQWAVRIALSAALAVTVAPAAMARAEAGFYLGVSAGESTYDIEKSELDDIVREVYFETGTPPLTTSSQHEDGDTALSLFAGYRFNPYIAVQASYVDLGTSVYRSRSTVNPPGPIASAPASIDFEFEGVGFGIAGLGSLPIGNVFDIHGQLGFFVASSDLTVTAGLGNVSDSETESLDSQNVFAGVGAAFHIGEHFSLSLDYSRYADLGDDDDLFEEDGEDDEDGGIDVDALTLSAIFRF